MTDRAGSSPRQAYEAPPLWGSFGPLVRAGEAAVSGTIFVPARFDVYKAVSRQIRAIFGEYTELVEPLSLDEAFLDVSHVRSATLVAREIKARILAETGLTASAGISVNKMLAKIASDYRKPDGLFTIPPERIEEFVAGLPVERFFGIGEVTAEKMHRLGIRTGADLRLWNEAALVQQFGKAGHSYYAMPGASTNGRSRRTGSASRSEPETTFAEDTDDRERLRLELSAVREEVWNQVMRHEFRGKTVVLKLKFDNFRQITRSKNPIHARRFGRKPSGACRKNCWPRRISTGVKSG